MTETTGTAGWPNGPTTLDALLSAADQSDEDRQAHGVPWREGHSLQVTAIGGLHSRARRRVSVVPGEYTSYVGKDASLTVTGDCDFTAGGDVSRIVQGMDETVVEGNASRSAHERMKLMGGGTYNRVWTGGIVRMTGMEGTICGGAFARIIAGGSMTFAAPFVMGDVYGASARAAAIRVQVAGVCNRTIDGAAVWAVGVYKRTTNQQIDPVSKVPLPMHKKLTRTYKIMAALCPFVDIAGGMIGAAAGIVTLVGMGLEKLAGKLSKNYKPWPSPARPATPRIRTQMGARVETCGSMYTVM